MNPAQPIIMYDSAEAAEFKEVTLKGWFSEKHFFGINEFLARSHGATHTKCQCGTVIPMRSHPKCEDCQAVDSATKYYARPFVEYDGQVVVCRDFDTYFRDESELAEYCEENELEEIELIVCELVKWHRVEEDYWSEMMPEDMDSLPKELQEALDAFNNAIDNIIPTIWNSGTYRTIYTHEND